MLPGIAFCNLKDEFDDQNWVSENEIDGSLGQQEVQQLPPGFAKLFRLTQLIIQYLLHSQKKLTDAIKILQNNNTGFQKVMCNENGIENLSATIRKIRKCFI